ATTLPAAPASFVASPLSPNQVGFTATANSLGHNIMIAWSTESTTAFGTPIALYPIGSTIPGGGVVHYVGPANEAYNHNNLSENTTYYYRAWSIVPGPIYSATSLLSTVKTPCSPFTQLPWYEGFEGVDLGTSTSSSTLFPTCWTKQNGDWATVKNSNHANDADARTGDQFLRNSWSATNEFMWTPGFALQSGTSYDFSFWWAGDNYAGWTGDVFYNSAPNGTGATQLGASFVTPLTTTTKTYLKVTQSFIPEESGTYYFAIRINATSAPWYLSFDDFELRVTPTAPIFVVTPQQADFGSQSIFMPSVPQVFTFYNDGIGTISVSSIAIEGTDANQFVLQPHQALPILLGPGQVATVSVTFAPGTAGPKTAQLVITDDLNNRAVHSLPISGIGVDPTITSFPYIESFDEPTFAPIGWTNTRTAGTGSPGIWERTTVGTFPATDPKSGPAMAQFRSFSFAAGTKAELITPPINFPEGNFRVSFWMYRDAGYLNNTDLVNVYFNTTNSLEDAILLGTVNRSMTLEPVVLTQGWHAYSYFLPEEATGNGRYIILEAVSAYGNNIFVDDFSISSPMVVTHTASNLSCFESNDGSIALNVEGGIPPLTILWKKDDVVMETTSLVLEQLSAAVYEYTVKEATGISVTELVTLTQPVAIPVATVTNTTVTYDGTVKTINAVAPAGTTLLWYTQAEGGEAVAAPAKTDAGVYNYWVAAKSTTTNCQSMRVGVVLTINKKSLTVKADDKSKCQFTDLPELTLTYTGFVANEGPAQLTALPLVTTTALPNSPIGTYPITVSGGISNNYSFVYQSGTLTVVRTPMVFAGGPGFVCVSEVFPIVAATATNFTTLVWTTSGNGTFSNASIINPVYTPGSMDIANGTVVLTLTADPGSYCSGIDQMVLSIQNDLPVSVTITQDDTEICIGELVTFNAIPVNGGLTPVFQWKVNGQNAGLNSSIFTYLPSNGDVVTVVVTTSISCALNATATSNAITVNVTPDLIAGVVVSTPSNAVCDFTPTSFIAVPVNGGANPTYQWKVNGVNSGTNAAQFTYVPLNGDEVSVVMTSSHSCAVVPVAISNVITMSVAPPFLELAANPTKGGTVSGGGNYPDGTEVTVTATAAAGWEFLNWRNMAGNIISTEAVFTYTINKCYEKLTATFSSTAKIAGQLKYFNENESIIPSPNNRGVFYVQIFENGQALSPRQVVAYNLEFGLDSYYEFTGVESGKDYSIRIWEEATNNTLGNTWSWNNWGGATSIDAFIISWMANMDPQLSVFPWIWPAGATALTPYSQKVADVNNNQMIANSDALMVLYRLLDQPGFSPFPGGAQNFRLATTKIEDHQDKAYPFAPEKLFTEYGSYLANASAPDVYQEVLLTNLSDGTNIYNIYFLATGDLNASYTPGGGNKQLAMLEYNGVINAVKGDEIMIPIRISQATDLGAITLGFSYNNDVIEVLDVVGYDLYNIDHENGTVKIAWYDHQSKSFANNQHLVILKARLKSEISTGTRYLELLPITELADGNAVQLQDVTLKADYIETAAGIISNPELLSINHSVFPNPFNDVTNIHYILPNAGKVQVVVFNHLGQEVIRIVDEMQTAGSHQVRLNNYELNGAGSYFYQ
ncbi:MAG: MBG domain-containing protein, partial [Bacteroidales bacterium]|nr:MBG domain-containing protein [Bacteroidales bacterium]